MVKRQPKPYAGTYCQKKRPAVKGQVDLSTINTNKKFIIEPTEYLSNKQKKELAKLMKDYSDFSVDQLKELLSKNRQEKTGSRVDLITRCSEGKLLGGLSDCPKCKGARLKFNIKTGEYFCKNISKSCNYKSCTSERTPWVE